MKKLIILLLFCGCGEPIRSYYAGNINGVKVYKYKDTRLYYPFRMEGMSPEDWHNFADELEKLDKNDKQ